LGSVFQYEDGTEFKLDRRYIEKALGWDDMPYDETHPYRNWKDAPGKEAQLEEPWDEYQARFVIIS